jgi:MoxR-like ATPase
MHHDPIIRRMHACALAFVPCLLWGGPGTGKTARVVSYGKARGLHVERWLLSRCEPIDLKPRIYHDGKVVEGTPPEIARLAKGGVLFADELNRSTREVEGAMLDRIDNPPPGVIVVAACNPPSRGQAARSLESAAANRFCHLDVDADSPAYASALLTGWPMGSDDLDEPDPKTLSRETPTARSIGSAFIRHRGESVLSKEPATPVEAGRAWPSPRSWDHALRLYAMARALSLGVEDTTALLGGCVGPGAAVEFLAFAADSEIDPEELIKNPKAWVPPVSRVDKTIAALTMVVGAVARDLTDARWKAAWGLVEIAADASQADAALFAASALISLEPKGKGLTRAHVLMPARIAKLLTAKR